MSHWHVSWTWSGKVHSQSFPHSCLVASSVSSQNNKEEIERSFYWVTLKSYFLLLSKPKPWGWSFEKVYWRFGPRFVYHQELLEGGFFTLLLSYSSSGIASDNSHILHASHLSRLRVGDIGLGFPNLRNGVSPIGREMKNNDKHP